MLSARLENGAVVLDPPEGGAYLIRARRGAWIAPEKLDESGKFWLAVEHPEDGSQRWPIALLGDHRGFRRVPVHLGLEARLKSPVLLSEGRVCV